MPKLATPPREVELPRFPRLEIVDDRDRPGVARSGPEHAGSVLGERLGRFLVSAVPEPPYRLALEIVHATARAVLGVVGDEQPVTLGAQSIGVASAPTSPISRFRGSDPSTAAA